MDTSINTQLTDIIQLKSQLFKLAEKGKLSKQNFNSMSRSLDLMSFSLVEEVNEKKLPDLVNQFQQNNPEFSFSPLEPIFRTHRFESLAKLRQDALTTIESSPQAIDASSLIKNQPEIIIEVFSWDDKQSQFNDILNKLDCQSTQNTALVKTIECFFATKQSSRQLLELPEFRANMVRHLSNANRIKNTLAMDFIHDEELIRSELRDREALIKSQFSQGEVIAPSPYNGENELYYLLKKETISPRATIDLANLILRWQGPNFYRLAHALFENTNQQQLSYEIFFIRTGIDPKEDRKKFKEWFIKGLQQEASEYQKLVILIDENRLLYDVLQIASYAHLSPEPSQHEQRWLSIAQSLRDITLSEEQLAISNKKDEDNSIEYTHQEDNSIKFTHQEDLKQIPEPRDKHQKLEMLEQKLQLNEIDEFGTQEASLRVPKKEISHEDALINQHSNWNEYIKPFLSENLLGLIGISFIIAAWPILSIMVWDKSEYYRIAAGAIPLLFLTIGSAWITHYFSNLKLKSDPDKISVKKDKEELTSYNQKPVQLFSCLTTWTLPFNILMAISIYDSGLILIASLMLFIYATTIWLISPWLTPSYGNSPKNYLLASHSILLLPTVLDFMQIGSIPFGIAGMSYLAFFFCVKILLSTSDKNKSFLYFIISLHLTISLIAIHIFYTQMPAIGTIAVITVLTALSLFYLKVSKAPIEQTSDKKTTAIILSGTLTIFGNLLALSDPIYLLVTLLLSGLFWFQLSNTFKDKKWPAEILAFHLIAYAATLQYHLELSQLFLFALVFVSGVGIWLIENRVVKHEIKLLSFGVPLALLITCFENSWSDSSNALLLIATLLVAVYNYYRCSKQYQIGLWYTSVIVIALLPMIHFREQYQDSLDMLALYLSILAITWAFISPKLKDIPAQLHRTSVLWGLSGLATFLLFNAAIKTQFEWSIEWCIGLLFSIIAHLIAAKRAQSLLPIYLATALIGLVSFWIKHEYELISKSGLGSAAMALILIFLAPRLQKLSYFISNKKPDRFFSRNFFLHSSQYLRLPLEHFSWALIIASSFKTILLFSPAIDNIKLSLACLINLISLITLSIRYQKSWLTTLALLPLFAFIGTITTSVSLSYTPLLLLATLFAWFYGLKRSSRLSEPLAIIHRPLNQVHNLLAMTFIIAGIICYPVMFFAHATTLQFLAFGGLSLFFIEQVFVRQKSHLYSHLNLIHVGILWTLIFGLKFYSPSEGFSLSSLTWYLLGFMTILFILGYVMEWFRNDFSKTYHHTIQRWLPVIAMSLIIILVSNYYLDTNLTAIHLTLCLIGFHCANRYYHHPLLMLSKWIGCMLLAYHFIPNNIDAVILGNFFFFAIEVIWHYFSKFKLLQIQGIAELNNTPVKMVAKIGVLGILLAIATHFSNFSAANTGNFNSYWLFTLLPLCLYLYKTLEWEVLGYAFALLFAYCNIFLVMSWNVDLQAMGLNQTHLLSGTTIISVLFLAIAVKLMPTNQTSPSQEILS